jgi:hypothetical protein
VWSLGVVAWQLILQQHEPYPKVTDTIAVITGLYDGSLDLRKELATVPDRWQFLAGWAAACLDRVSLGIRVCEFTFFFLSFFFF